VVTQVKLLPRLKTRKQSVSKKFGLTKETTADLLQRLFTKRAELQKEYEDLSAQNTGMMESLGMIPIRQQREAIDKKIADIRDLYGLRVMEGLEEESRRLKLLTIVLIALTAVLTIFTGFLETGDRSSLSLPKLKIGCYAEKHRFPYR